MTDPTRIERGEATNAAPITSARLLELSAKATGGEWNIGRFASTSIDAGNRGIATTGGYQSNREVTLPENEANAALIAAVCSEPARLHIAKALALREAFDELQQAQKALSECAYDSEEWDGLVMRRDAASAKVARLTGFNTSPTAALAALVKEVSGE
jgi:hypothetical protein